VRGSRARASGPVGLLVAAVLLLTVACDEQGDEPGGEPACASPTAEPTGSGETAACDDTGGGGY
jgi:hypothetical protein